MSKTKTPATDEVVTPAVSPAIEAPATDVDAVAAAADANAQSVADAANATPEVQSEAEQLFDQVMAESGEQLMAEVQADIAENGIPLSDEEKAEIKKTTDAALAEAARIRDLTPEQYEEEFGFKFLDGLSITEQTIQKSEHVHKDRIFGLLQKTRELYVG